MSYELFLSVDVGGSQTKVVYQKSSDPSPRYLLMPPEVEIITLTKERKVSGTLWLVGYSRSITTGLGDLESGGFCRRLSRPTV